MKAMILAAGRGERMRPLTDETPKSLLQVNGKAFIEYRLEALMKEKITDIVINVSYKAERIMQVLGNGRHYGVSITYSIEKEETGLETGGGIYQALPLLGNAPFMVMSSDIWTDYPLRRLPQRLNVLAHLVLVDNPFHHPKGDFALEKGNVVAQGDPMLNFAGIGVYHPKLFEHCQPGKFRLAPLLYEAAKKGLVTGEYYQGIWLNIGTPEQLRNLQETFV